MEEPIRAGVSRTGRMPIAPPSVPAMALTPKEIMGILRRHILLMVSFTILGFLVGGATWFLLRTFWPKYTSLTYIQVLPPQKVDPMMIYTPLPEKDIAYQFRVSMAALIKEQSTLEALLKRDKIRATKWFAQFDNDIPDTIDELKDHLGAGAQRDSQYIAVSMTCGDKKEAALIVNEMVDLFVSSRTDSSKGEIGRKLKELTDQLENIERDLRLAETQIEDIRVQSGLSGLGSDDQFRNVIHVKMADLENRQNELATEIKDIETNVKTLREQTKGPIGVQVERQVESDPVMVSLAQRLTLLEGELARKLAKLGENHREIREIQELIRQTKEERKMRQVQTGEQTRQANYKDAQDMLLSLESRSEELEKMRAETAAKQKDLDRYKALYDQRAAIRDDLRKRRDDINQQIIKYKIMLNDPEGAKVQSMGLAPEPLEMSSPRWQLYFPGGTMLGMLMGVALAFLIEMLNDLVRTPSDVSKHLHIPLLGLICHADEDEQVEGVELCHVVRQAPYSITSECYRQFRTNLKLTDSAKSKKILFVTSGSAGEGKTSTAINLATTFIAEDKKVLLIDSNFRRPTSHMMFPKAKENGSPSDNSAFGLSNLLMGQCSYEQVIRPSGIESLDIIDCGPLPANPAELLGNTRMKQLLENCRDSYDYIIIDGPPILLISEAKILAVQADSTLLVFNATMTRRGTAQRTIRELREINGQIVGCVLMGAKAMKGGYFHELFRSYQDYQKVQLIHSIQ